MSSPFTWLGVILAAVVAAFVLVGTLASPDEGFDWELASVFGTAVGTTLLALVTGWLAFTTRADFVARERPRVLILEVSVGQHDGDLWTMVVALANAGLGPALDIRLEGTYEGEVAKFDVDAAKPIPLLDPRDRTFPEFVLHGPLPPNPEHFKVTGTYQDRSQRERHKVTRIES